jgi:hypothetical protein
MFRIRLLFWCLAAACLACSGCADEHVDYGSAKQIEDRISAQELESFLRIVEILPEPKLAAFPALFVGPPQWTTSRTLPVKDLIKEEEELLQERSNIDSMLKHFPKSRFVQRALRRERMGEENFVSMYIALGVALSRSRMPASYEFDSTIARGHRAIGTLRRDTDIFSSLSEDAAYAVQEQAAWVSLVNRLQKLKRVPRENVELVESQSERLAPLFAAEFTRDPLGEFAKVLKDTGIPFDEPPGKASDDDLPWSRRDAIVGNDKPAAQESALAPVPGMTP